ncbi:MAG: hypothetical protein KDA88_21410, partial [Planctomycetaceae bacterium]|nr:hypothetical protein [Planctomycetaceae bacterium]
MPPVLTSHPDLRPHPISPRANGLRVVFALLFCWMLAPALLGQDKIPTASIAVKIGTELESRQSWREAYRHYKDAVKQFPEDAILQQ